MNTFLGILQNPESRRPIPRLAERQTRPPETGRNVARPPEPARPKNENGGLVAALRKSLADKDAALQRTSYAAIRLQKQLEDSIRQNKVLRKQLSAFGVRGTRPAAVPSTAVPQDRAGLRKREAAARLAVVAGEERRRRNRNRLAAAAVAAAVLILACGIWSLLPDTKPLAPFEAEKTDSPPPRPVGRVIVERTLTGKEVPEPGTASTARVRFEYSLNRLNRALVYAPFGSPEEVLRSVCESGDPGAFPVCDFSWNYGQPALLYHAGMPLDVALNRCATAVESYVFRQAKAPAASGRGG